MAIRGMVTTSAGEPIPDASVFVESGPSHPDIVAVTGVQGAYELSGLAPGVYVIRVQADGFTGISGRVPVRHGQATRLNVALEFDQVPEIDGQDDVPELSGQDTSAKLGKAARGLASRRRRAFDGDAAA